MLRSLSTGVSGLQQFQQQMDVIGNNISNVNTNGFKSSSTVFEDVLSQTFRGAGRATARSPSDSWNSLKNIRPICVRSAAASMTTRRPETKRAACRTSSRNRLARQPRAAHLR